MAFTDSEKGRIRHFLAYPSWSAISNGIQLGFPAGAQPLFLVEQAFQILLPTGEEAVRRDLCECEAIERQLSAARKRFAATQLGELKTNPDEPAMLRRELTFWVLRMASDLGVVQNPYAASEWYEMAGSLNARVVG